MKNILYLIIIIIIYILYIYNKYNKLLEYRCLEDIKINSGDIILFYWKDTNWIQYLINPFTHAGIVVKKDNKLYIIETHSLGDTKNIGYNTKGINIYLLEDRIKNYKGINFLLKLKYKLDKDKNNKIIRMYNKYKNIIKFPNRYKFYYINKCIFNIYSNDRYKLYCFEFIYKILIKCNIISNKKKYFCKISFDLLNLPEYKYCGKINKIHQIMN